MKYEFQVTYFLWRARANKDGRAPVLIRSAQNNDGKQIKYNTGVKMHPQQWNQKKNEPNTKSDMLLELEMKLRSIYRYLITQGKKPTLKDMIPLLDSWNLTENEVRNEVVNRIVWNKKFGDPARHRGYIYIAKDDALPDYLKIGFSKNPKIREATLLAERPTISFIRVVRGTIQHERKLHEHFKDRRVRGEWFLISVEDAEEALVSIVSKGEPVLSGTVP